MSDNLNKVVEEILDFVQDYTIQSAMGGTPFKTQEENEADNAKAYDEGRAKATQALTQIINNEKIDAVNDALAELLGEIDTMPHYIRSKFAEHVETATAADDAEMLLANEVKIIIKAQQSKATLKKGKSDGRYGRAVEINAS